MWGTTLEVTILADVSEAHSAILSVYQSVTGPLWHEPLSFPLAVLDPDWSTKCKWRGPWILTICCGLRIKMSIYQLLRYPVAFLIDGISNEYIHELNGVAQ